MDLEYGPQYDDFRAEVISFIKENEKTKLTGPPRSDSRVEWQQKLIDNGYFARSIPKEYGGCLLYTSPSPRDRQKSRMPSSA